MAFNSEDKNVKDMGRQSGKAFAEGLGVGLGEESYRAITAVEDVYVELESLTKNAAKNAEKLNKKQQQRKLDNLKNAFQQAPLWQLQIYLKQLRREYCGFSIPEEARKSPRRERCCPANAKNSIP